MKKVIISLIFVSFLIVSVNAEILSSSASLKDTTEKSSLIVVIGKVTKVRPMFSFKPFSFGNLKVVSIKIEKLLESKTNDKEVKTLFYRVKRGFIKSENEAEFRILYFTKGKSCVVFYTKERRPTIYIMS